MRYLPAVLVIVATGGNAAAQRWQDATADCLGTTAEWSNKVDVGDVDGDGKVDLLIANGGNYDNAGTPEPVRVWKNNGTWGTAAPDCTEISAQAVLGFTGLSRVIKAIDLDGDKDLDLITGGAYQTQLKLFTRNAGTWSDASAQLPQQLTSIGDIEAGDVDGDGDLDLLLAEWGAISPDAAGYPGGRTRLYLNNGQGTFTEATVTHMPDILMKWSWDVELADVDNDWDLDALVACKRCTTSYLFTNDGTGHFTDAPNALPQFANNYDFEPMDIDADGDLDLITINDGAQFREHLLVNNGQGVFADETATRLAGTANPANADDNAAIWLDADADGDADLLLATLGNDRLLINTAGVFTLSAGATPNDTPGSLGLAAADFNDDGRLDLLHGQGEVAFADKVQLATAQIAVDTVAPSITVERKLGTTSVGVIHARVHDHIGPS
nr:VCBS repeat-containing protein [Deltaproteobacteria bacterium]